MGNGSQLFSLAHKRKENDIKGKQERIKINKENKFLNIRVNRNWNILPN